MDDIKTNATNNLLSKPTICKFLKELNITLKKINNYIVCKDINKIIDERTTFGKLYNNQLDTFNNFISIDESGLAIHKLIKHKRNKQHVNLLMK